MMTQLWFGIVLVAIDNYRDGAAGHQTRAGRNGRSGSFP
jgi:hypothetical protein